MGGGSEPRSNFAFSARSSPARSGSGGATPAAADVGGCSCVIQAPHGRAPRCRAPERDLGPVTSIRRTGPPRPAADSQPDSPQPDSPQPDSPPPDPPPRRSLRRHPGCAPPRAVEFDSPRRACDTVAQAHAMPLFQKPPHGPEELERSKPLAIPPQEVHGMDERTWYARAFRGDAAQLTFRAVAMGTLLGFFLAFTNVYVGLKAGWGLGVALTACIASFTIWTALLKLGIAKSPMTILENNCMQSTASAAGYSTTALLVSAVPAMLLLSVTDANPRGTQLAWPLVAAWVLCVAALGVLMAIPMKRGMINRERLTFPSGTAAAVLLQSLYSEGAEALAKGRALVASGVVGALVPLLTSLNAVASVDAGGRPARRSLLPPQSNVFDWLPRLAAARVDPKTHAVTRVSYPMSAYDVTLDHSLVLVGAGAIVGLRTTLSMLAGGLVLVFAIGPTALDWTWTNVAGQLVAAAAGPGTLWKEIGLWFGAPLMVAYGLVTFALQFRTVGRAFAGLRGGLRGGRRAAGDGDGDDTAARVEVPMAWFAIGTTIAGAAVVVLAR